ncbi:MAG: choice-of-anchor D domain-containing protein [Verrucomicrobia bacterium]|nr:choice-of-anchor D domain-containing protein [Verrucomicrobiota bacterium]
MNQRLANLPRIAVQTVMAVLWLAFSAAVSAQSTDPRLFLDGLRSLALEARIELQVGGAGVAPKLFTQAVPDGRTWMSYLADTLGLEAGGDATQPGVTNQWALVDDAVSLLLAEAEAMKTFAVGKAGTPDEVKFQNARRQYLAGAARLLKFYKVTAGDVYDATAGALPDPFGLPDWLLPGEIQLKEIGGAGRLNTDSGDFAGRLSGTMVLPGLGATLVVKNASFDSDGRIDLSAYGSVQLPVGVLSIPPRQPIHYRSTPERGQLLEGGARLTLTNGLRFDASMLLADPNYCFGLAARGLEFDLGKELLVRVPTLNLNQVNAFGDTTRDAFADYFLGLNGAMETLLTAATNFPPIDETGFGQPPEFKPPQITADFSVLNAWSAEIISKTRAGLVNAQQNLQPVLDSVAKLNADARAATNALGDERSKMASLAARFELRRRMQEASELAAAQQLAGAGDITLLQAQLVEGVRQEGSNIVALVTPDLPDRLAESAEVVRLLLANASSFQRLGVIPPSPALAADPCLACLSPVANPQQRAEALALCAARRQAARFGLNPITGSVSNTVVFNALSEAELYRAGRILSDVEAALTLQGVDVQGQFTTLLGPILSRQRERLLEALETETSLQRNFELITLITDNAVDSEGAGVTVDAGELVARMETLVAPRLAGVTPQQIDAARVAANQAIAQRRRQISSEVAQVTGRYRSVGVIDPGDAYQPDFLTQLDRFFQIVGQPVPPGIGSGMDAYVRFKVQELRARPFSIEFLTNRLGEAQSIASGIIGLTDWADTRLNNDFGVLTNLQFTITNFSVTFTAAAELQRGWWLIDRYQDALRQHTAVYGSNVNAGLRLAEQQSRNVALLASGRVAGAFSNLVANLVSHQDVIVPLPGNVEITHIFGRLCYNRQTGFLQGCFGGRVEFPEVNTNLFFEITEACLDSALGYDIAGTMRTPLPFGQARLQVGIDIAGSPSGVASFSGSGTLAVPNPSSADRVFDVALTYDPPANRMAFDAQGNNLDLRLSEDFVLFGAGFGFDLKPGSPQGSFRLNGSAGLFAKAKPLPTVVGGTNFHLSIENLTTVFSYTTNAFSVSLSNGTIRLPDFFHNGLCPTNQGQAGTGPAVAIVPSNPISVTVGTGPNPSASFSGAVDIRNIGFSVPGLTNLGLEICSARLAFRSNELPALTNLNATLTIPLPGQTAVLDLAGVDWGLDGFPTAATIGLRQELLLLDASGFTLHVRTNSTFGFATSVDGAGKRTTVFTITGGMRGTFNGDLLYDAENSGAFSFETGGTFRWQTDELPTIALDSVTFAARLRLGGVNGFELLGVDANGIPDTANTNSMASITLTGLTNLFDLSPERRFEVNISGAMGSAEFVFFGLGNAKFVFDGAAPEPQFTVQSLGFREGTQLKLLGQSLLPFRITAGSIAFVDPAKPLNQLFAPENLRFTFSGVVDISLAAPDSNEPGKIPRLFGAVDNVQVSLPNGFNGPPQFSVNTFVLSLENLTIGDMAGLSGGLAVGNLNQPEDLFFAGMVGGGYNGVGIKAVVATRLDGLLGLCLAVNAGAAGIPLDGGTLGGILLTGAEGGVSFLNNFADPCDFKSYLGLTESGGPAAAPISAAGDPAIRAASGPRVSQLKVINWQQLDRFQKLHEQRKRLQASFGEGFANAALEVRPVPASVDATATEPLITAAGGGAGANVPCPTGDCPPATLNLLCQRHPSVAENPSSANYDGAYREKVIFKYTSINREVVDDILAAANINLNGSPSAVAANFADGVLDFVTTLVPRAPTGMPADQAQELNAFIDASLNAMRDSVATAVQIAFETAAPGRTPLEVLYETSYAGVGCVDVTIQLKGTFSYSPISAALSVTGGAVVSTTGSAGVLGSVNVFGLPVGTAELFYSLTDTNGNPNPALCGGAALAVGPLGFGQMGLAIGCDECVTGTLQALLDFVQGLTGDIATQASPIIYAFIEHAAGHRLTGISGRPLTDYFGPQGSGALLTQQEQVAVMAALFNLPEVAKFLQANPGAVSEFGNEAVAALSSRVIGLTLGIYNGTNPRLQFCGEVEPRIFGISLTGGNTLVAGRLYADKTNLRGDATFSPSYVFGNMPFFLLSSGAINNIVPALDEATMGFSLGLPLVNETTLRLLGTNPVEFASTQVNHLLANATLTFGYELSPFGFKLADGEGRISLPTLDQHPDNPARRAAQSSRYDGAGRYLPPTAPDRSAILKAALDSNVLAQATWAGRGADLAMLFPPGSSEASAVASRELVRDYFPYGGFLGASKVQLPKPITDAPPLDQMAKLFAPPTNIFEQLAIAQDVFNNYILGSREVGELMVYVPFPRPPTNFWLVAQGPQALIDSITQSDLPTLVANLNLYPTEQFFMRGGVNAQFLGLPIGEGELTADPVAGLFRLTAGVPADSWMRSFFDASLNFEIKRADYIAASGPASGAGTNVVASPEARLQAALDQLLASANGSTAQKQAAINNAVARITDTLPKASLELSLNNLSIPPPLTNVLTASAAAHFYAYSPRFEPGFAGTGPVADARRNGGVAFQGNFNFANYVVIDNAELAVASRGVGLPALSGLFEVPTLGVPGLALHDAHFEFNSDPAVGGSFIAADGSVDPIVIRNPFNQNQTMLTIRNLTNVNADISAEFDLRKAVNGAPLPGFAISPSRVDMPMLGPGLSARIHGATTNDPFSFSSTGPWGATVSIVGQLGVKDLNGNEVLRIGAVGTPFSASITGDALTLDKLDILLPTNVTLVAFPGTTNALTFSLTSGGVTNRLMISGDGTFVLDGGIAGNLPLNGVGFGSISAGATIHIDNTQLRVTISGNLNGGALDSLSGNATVSGISGQFVATRNGVSLSAVGTISPMQFGVFRVSGVSGGNITAVLTNTGFSIPTGARLRILAQGYPTTDIFTLNAFSISGNGNFAVAAQSGELNLPGYFNTTAGSFVLQRSGGVASLDVVAPAIELFPGKPYESGFTPPLQHVFIESTGRFYADTGNRQFPLPGGFVARGKLEFGYEPDFRQPGIGLPSGTINFGTVTYGFNSNKVINVTNTGTAPLFVDISTPLPEVFNVTPASLNLDPGESAALSVRFIPTAVPGPVNALISFFHNAPGGLTTRTASGTVRATPLMLLSSPALDVGSAKVNQTVMRPFRVDNLGFTNLVITNRIVSGPFTITPTNANVPPGGHGVFNVTFTPGSIANFNGSLEIRSNDGLGTRNVPLSGSGAVISWVDFSAGGGHWRAIATGGSSNAVVVTTNRVFYTDNKGHSWFNTSSNLLGGWRAAAMVANSRTGWIAGDNVFKKTTDGGRTWQEIAALSSKATSWRAVTEQPGLNRVVLVGKGTSLSSSANIVAIERASGFDIETLSSSPLDSPVGVAWARVGASTVGLVAGFSSIYRSADGGTNWSSVANPQGIKSGIAMNSSGMALAVANTTFVAIDFNPPPPIAYIHRSIDSGATWSQVFVATGFVFNAVSMDGAVAYAVGKGSGFDGRGVVYRSGDSGATWQLQEVESPGLFAVSAKSSEAFVAGEDGEIWRRPSAPPSRGVLTFEPGLLNFGFIPVNDSAPRALVFGNVGISNIVITNVTISGTGVNQFAIGGTFPKTIPPGGSDSINVFFNPTGVTNVNALLRINANDPEGVFSAQLAGASSQRGWVLKAPLTTNNSTALGVRVINDTLAFALTSGDLYKSTNNGASWQVMNTLAGSFRTMFWVDANEGYIGGGTFSNPFISDGSSFIHRTTNGGVNWATVHSGTDFPVEKIDVLSSGTGYAVTLANPRIIGIGSVGSGSVLKTTNSGLAWFSVARPETHFNGSALATVSTLEVFASDGDKLYRSADGAGTWVSVVTNGGSFIHEVDFFGSSVGWLVGARGSSWRTTIGGDTPSEWLAVPFPTTNDLNSVHFASSSLGWAVPTTIASQAAIFRSDDGGATWRDELAESPYGGPTNLIPTVVFGRPGVTNSLALGTGASVRRIENFTNEFEGVSVSQPSLDFGQAVQGTTTFTNFLLRNIGDRTLTVSNLLVDGFPGFNEGFVATNAVPFSIPISGSRLIGVVSSNLVVGTNEASLSVISDGARQSLDVNLRAVVQPAPVVVSFETVPPGLTLRIDGSNVVGPVSRTIRTGTAMAGDWAMGSAHSVVAVETQLVNGVTYSFAGWLPFEEASFTYVATNRAVQYVASYIPEGEEAPEGGVALFSAAGGPPSGLPTGPYLRLSNASISNALLGNFAVSGSVLLSADVIDASLSSQAFRLPANPANPAILRVSAGAWRFTLSNQLVRLKAQSPSIKMLSNTVNPPSLFTLDLNLSNANFRSNFSLPDGAPIAPGLLEIGPSSASLSHTSFFSLRLSGQVRALRKPDGESWALNITTNITLSEGPFTNTLPLVGTVLAVPVPGTSQNFLTARGTNVGGTARVELRRAGNGAFSLFLTNLAVDVLGQNLGRFSGLASQSGQLTLSAGAPASPFVLGPWRWHASGNSSFDWNLKNGSLKFNLSGGSLRDSGNSVPGWPDGGLNMPGIEFDSTGDFEKTITLNSLNFDGIVLGQADDAGDRYVTFKRENGVLSLKVRDRIEFFDSTMKIKFNINSAGAVSGSFKGSFGVDFGGLIGFVEFGNVEMSYDSSEPTYQFKEKIRVAGNNFRVKFGSGGARVCYLYCDDNGCSEVFCLP